MQQRRMVEHLFSQHLLLSKKGVHHHQKCLVFDLCMTKEPQHQSNLFFLEVCIIIAVGTAGIAGIRKPLL